MQLEAFIRRLRDEKSVGYDYRADGKTGMIAVWWNLDKFVLTWEEFPDGDFFNEQNYTRDEVHHFQNLEKLLEFLKENQLDPKKFTP